MSNKTKTCKKPTSINYCQNKYSGGHQGTIFIIKLHFYKIIYLNMMVYVHLIITNILKWKI